MTHLIHIYKSQTPTLSKIFGKIENFLVYRLLPIDISGKKRATALQLGSCCFLPTNSRMLEQRKSVSCHSSCPGPKKVREARISFVRPLAGPGELIFRIRSYIFPGLDLLLERLSLNLVVFGGGGIACVSQCQKSLLLFLFLGSRFAALKRREKGFFAPACLIRAQAGVLIKKTQLEFPQHETRC